VHSLLLCEHAAGQHNACCKHWLVEYKGSANQPTQQPAIVTPGASVYASLLTQLNTARRTTAHVPSVLTTTTSHAVCCVQSGVARIGEEWLYEYYGSQGSNVKVVTVYPGSMYTDFARHTIPGERARDPPPSKKKEGRRRH